MSMTKEQEEKARAALLQKKIDDFTKRVAYENHITAAEWVKKYNLPYRVALDYLKTPHKGEVKINPLFPLPGYPIDELLTVSVYDLDKDNPKTYQESEDGKRIYNSNLFNTPLPEVVKKIREHNQSIRPEWNLNTAAGLREWERLFAFLLVGYDIDSFTAFDMFGDKTATKTALLERKRYYKQVQERYKTHTEPFLTAPPPYLPEYAEKYTENEFVIDLTEV